MFGNFFLFKIPFPGQSSIPTSFVSLFVFYIFSYLLSKSMGCFSGCLLSSASIQKLFCGIYSAFKCYFDEFVWEKVVSPSYSSTILGLLPASLLFSAVCKALSDNHFTFLHFFFFGIVLVPASLQCYEPLSIDF